MTTADDRQAILDRYPSSDRATAHGPNGSWTSYRVGLDSTPNPASVARGFFAAR